MQSTVKFLPKSQVEIKVYVDQNDWQEAEKLALQELSLGMEVPGFRRGRIPLVLVKERVGNSPILLKETLKQLTNLTYKQSLQEYQLLPIELAHVSIPQMEKDDIQQAIVSQVSFKPMEIVFKVTIWPKIKLGDYQKIVKKEVKSSKTIETAATVQEAKVKAEKAKKQAVEVVEKSVRKTPQEIKNEKTDKILNALVENIQFDLPEILLQTEVNRRLKETEESTKKLGLTLEEYLRARMDNLADFKDRIRQSAEGMLKARLILTEIAKDIGHSVENAKDLEYIMDKLLEP